LSRLLAVAEVVWEARFGWMAVVKFGSPRTTSAAAPLEVGIWL
jgi:hypothetical protein